MAAIVVGYYPSGLRKQRLHLSTLSRRSGSGPEVKPIVHGLTKVLLAAKVAFRRLHRGMAE